MKFLVALALLVIGVAYAQRPPVPITYPEFLPQKTQVYDVTINMTAGVLGMSSQTSKSVFKAELKIYAESKEDIILQFRKVRVSNSLPSVPSFVSPVHLEPSPQLEEYLAIPVKAKIQRGKVISYKMSRRESLESQKIKRAILRNLEVHIDNKLYESDEGVYEKPWPITYNLTRSSPAGNYESHYVITSSPYPDFPKNVEVLNISRSDNQEVLPYLAYKTHHNYAKQGCPEVCKMDHVENRFGAGCPIHHEPYHTPMKRSFVQHHNLKMVQRTLIIDAIRTIETHFANLYDQNMEIDILTIMNFVKATPEHIPEPTDAETYTDLHDWHREINEKEIEQLCKHPDTASLVREVKMLLKNIADIVYSEDIVEEKSKLVGEMLAALQTALQKLPKADLRTLQRDIVNYDELSNAEEKEKIKRQIWLDLLPVIGTTESVSFIVELISENMNLQNKHLSLWESKTILEDLPQNIHLPNERTIKELSTLLEILKEKETPGYNIFYSATHLSVARVIRSLCSNFSESVDTSRSSSRFSSRSYRVSPMEESDEFSINMSRVCPREAVTKFIEQIRRKLENTESKTQRVIYIETLARTGLEEVLPLLKQYIYGKAPIVSSRSPRILTQSYIDYLKTIAIYSLHNIVERSPRTIQDILVPVFFNKTEPPKVRLAAFTVIIKSQPTLGLLQHIAEQSWHEPSEEVASHVVSAFETFGNATHPCHRLTAMRIKKVMPQLKWVDYGKQKAKNIRKDLWDELSAFGIEKRCSYVPSNESFIPSSLYGSLGYNVDSLKDYLFKYALNMQGLTSRNVFDTLLQKLGLTPAEDIPKESESKIFPDLDIVPRDPEPWRLSLYHSLFYSSSYYYFDAEETTHRDIIKMLADHIKHYITRDTQGSINGHLVKVYIPSSYHVKTIGQSLPYPIQFEMRHPVLISLKLKLEQSVKPTGARFEVSLSPSIYHSAIYTQEILNLGDCKTIGVYHLQKTAVTYPVVITADIESLRKYSFSYKFPELPKYIFSYRSEAGTYSGRNYVEPLPAQEYRRTIKSLPSQLTKPISWGIVGLPKFEGEIKTEDMQLGMEDLPRDVDEATWLVIRRFLNAGWRRKSVDISRVSDSALWLPATEVKVHVNYTRLFTSYKTEESDWSSDLKFDKLNKEEDVNVYAAEGQKIYEKLSRTLNHIKDIIRIRVEQKAKSTIINKANLNLEYAHTLGGFLHFIHFNASAAFPKIFEPIAITSNWAAAFIRRPNEFKYNEEFGKQKGLLIGSLSFTNSTPFHNPLVIAKAVLKYKPLQEVLEMEPLVDSKEFEPETHEECLSDVRKGKSLSVSCLKAIREKAIYNNLELNAIWKENVPHYFEDLVKKIDLALKYIFYHHMTVERTPRTLRNNVYVEATYIDKMTDKPVLDIVAEKPSETLRLHRINTGELQPLSSVESIVDTYAAAWTNNTYPAICAMMDKYVRTFDMKTYPLPRDTQQCRYVLATHCMEKKKFAVIVQHSPEHPGTQEIHMYVGKDEIVLVPGSRFRYKVKINGREETVFVLAPLMLNERDLITAFVNIANDGSSFVEIHARKAGIKVRYDGVRVKVQVHPRYKGELCGMCSEFNGEIVREYRGVDRCLYTNAEDFVKSSSLGSCDRTPVHPHMCSDEVTFSWGRKQQEQQADMEEMEGYEPTLRRNIVISRGSNLCFSTRPVPVCDELATPIRTESREVDLHCLPKSDKNARKLVTESKRRILGELENKHVDFTERVEVAQMC